MSCIDTLDNFERKCKGRTPGFKGQLHVEFASRVNSIPYPENATEHTVTGDIVMKTVAEGASKLGVFYSFPVSTVPGKSKLNSKEEGDADSSAYSHEIEFFIPGATPEASHKLKGTKGIPLVCIIEDKDDQKQIVGDPKDGAFLKFEEVNEQGARGYNVKLSWTSKYPLWFYEGTITT